MVGRMGEMSRRRTWPVYNCRFKVGGGAWRAGQRLGELRLHEATTQATCGCKSREVSQAAAASAVAQPLGLPGFWGYGGEATLPRSGLLE